MLSDRHVHTPFCLHGSSDALENYVKFAIQSGLEEITFTEHAPLPMEDPLPDKDSAMRTEDVEPYLAAVQELSEKYANTIKINAGFEVDYIEGKEAATLAFLEAHQACIPHSILSVHFVQTNPDEYFCVDLDRESFVEKGLEIGFEELYSLYEKTIHKALAMPYGPLTPKKIGHLNLIHKFQKAYTVTDPIDWKKLMDTVKKNGYILDYNFAGIDKPDYGKTYPSEEMMDYARAIGLAYELGSDAHAAHEVARYFDTVLQLEQSSYTEEV